MLMGSFSLLFSIDCDAIPGSWLIAPTSRTAQPALPRETGSHGENRRNSVGWFPLATRLEQTLAGISRQPQSACSGGGKNRLS